MSTRNVLEWLEEAERLSPEAVAFDAPGESLTWREVACRARAIGSCLAARIPAQSPVLILMDKSPACLCAMLGTAYAGCFYTPLDASMPEKRMAVIAEILRPAAVIYGEKFGEIAKRIANRAVLCGYSGIDNQTDEDLLRTRKSSHIDNDLLYVLFTSGSTGVPKGVSITHRSVVDFVEWACEALKLPFGVRFGSQAPFYFDNSVLDIYCSMHMRGSLFLIPRGDFMFPKRLLGRLADAKVDTIFWVPSALTSVANAGVLAPENVPTLKRVFFCGEVMPCRTLNLWKSALPEADYVNMYGPTEITDVCAWYRVDREFADTDSLPIGFPCANTRILLIDGELCVGGTCLSPGYYNAPEKTAAAFVQNPQRPQIREIIYKTGDLAELNDRGELMFLGRMDSQIKRSGYRIELGEIECALQSAHGVDSGFCFYDAAREKIVCVWTGEANEKEIRDQMKVLVPKYMLPDVWMHQESLPSTGSGKIDRVSVKNLYEHSQP
ncbi:MAG: AMP-binding protein [Clostridia bacterium]|nr:AMP-binding protein [Clostridia bacterium]